MTTDDVALAVESRLRGLGAKERRGELWFLCPVHNEREPSAAYHPEKRIWYCQACGAGGGLVGGSHPIAPLLGIETGGTLDLEAIRAEREAVMTELEQAKRDKARALADWWAAHRRELTLVKQRDVLDALIADGIPEPAIEHFGFGEADYYGRPALAIPWMVHGELRALQYRLLDGTESGDRYRWHTGGRATIFNADAVLDPHDDTMIVVEGAKKAASLWGHGLTSVSAVVNKTGWREEYVPPYRGFDRVVFMLDPDATAEAAAAAATLPNGRVARVPMKPDDFLVATGGDVDALWQFVEDAHVSRRAA